MIAITAKCDLKVLLCQRLKENKMLILLENNTHPWHCLVVTIML